MNNPFETEINENAHQNVFDSTTMAVSDVLGAGAVATAVDFGASVWNSLPFTEEVETADLLGRVSTNALQVYQENPEAIHTASFVAGLFAPMGIASKGMQALRAGQRGISWFGNAERAADLKKLASAVEETKNYRDITRGIYAKTAVNQAIDAVAMEAAFVGMMSAHPFMEDYMKDLPSNFALGALLGGGLGAGVGVIADRFAIKAAVGGVHENVLNTIKESIVSARPDMTNAFKMQAHEATLKNLEEIVQQRTALGKDETNDLLFYTAKEMQLAYRADQVKLFEAMVSPEIKAMPQEQKDRFMRLLVDRPEMLGVENVKLLTEADVTADKLVKAPKFSLNKAPDFVQNTKKGFVGPLQPKSQEAVYFPDLGLYGTKDDAIHYADASVFGQSKEQMAKNLPYNYGKVPNYDTALELLSKSSAEVQKEYIAAWERVKSLSPKEFAKMHIGEGDAALINAVLYRMVTDPEVAGMTVKVSNNLPIMKQIVKEHVEKLVQEGKITAQEATHMGPDAVYMAKINAIGDLINSNDFKVRGHSLITSWINGPGKAELSKLAHDHYLAQVGGYGKAGVDAENVAKFDKIYNSPESKALRAKFMEVADPDGNVYLYRGMKTNTVKGQAFLESMTTHYQKAAQFTGDNTQRGIKLYKVHVDDIVTGFKDVGSGKHNAEVIVRASARPVIAELSDNGKMALKKAGETVKVNDGLITTTKTTTVKETVEEGVKQLNAQELSALFIASKQEAIDSMIGSGMPLHSISIKTNTDINIVKAYALAKQQTGLDAFVPPNVSPMTALNKIKRYDEIDEVLKKENQPLVLTSNLQKNPRYIQNKVALDNKNLRTMNREFMALSMLKSRSTAVKEMADMLYGPEGLGKAVDMIESKIGAVNNDLAGSAFLNSFDFFTRNMKDVGPAVSAIGKGVERISKAAIDKVMKPIEDAMVAVTKDAAALVEFSTFYNVNAGLKGWRGIDKDGYLVQKVMKENEEGKMVQVLERVKFKPMAGVEEEYRVVSPSVRSLIDAMQAQSTELRELANSLNRIKGTPDISDIGLWIPSFNPVDKHIAYVHDMQKGTTKLLWAKTQGEFETMLKAYKEKVIAEGQQDVIKVVTKDQQADWNLLNGRLDPIHMERADIGMQKGGASAAAIIKPDIALFGEIAKGYEFYITSQVRNLADLNMSEITDSLRKMSGFNRRFYDNQPFSEVKKALAKPKDAAAVIHNTLLGNSNLGEYAGWQWANKTFETTIGLMSNTVADVWNATIKPLTRTMLGGKKELDIANAKKIDYKAFNDELEKRGIIYPWKAMDQALAEKLGFFSIENHPDVSKRVVYASNALAATMALRFAELAQPLVNAISMPVLTTLAIAQKMPDTFMGAARGTMNIAPTQVMYEGIRAMNSPIFAGLNKRWEAAGYFKPMVSEASDVMRATRRFDKGAIAKIENALDSSVIQVMSKPADYAETLTRKAAMNIGAQLAKRMYPELDEAGITIFARDFMDKSIGNFHASQRPVMYQGTLGVALGLFQTYMWTLGQNVYRLLERKQYRELGKAALLQSSLFGTQSLPGFEAVSHAIGDNFSDDNVDLVTGTYRALPNKLADFVVYGLPSNLGMGTYSTRGDVDPRLPNIAAGFDNAVAVNFAIQTMGMMGTIKDALGSENPDMARALGQAFSVQSMSRPVARGAELLTGYSVTRQGNTVQVPEEVWTFSGVAARVMATRPLEEQKLRDADHLNTFYGTLDRQNRQDAMQKIRTAVRNGTMTDEKLAKYAEEYFRHGGSPTGWRSAINEAIARTNQPGTEGFLEKLKPDNPLNFMINNLE